MKFFMIFPVVIMLSFTLASLCGYRLNTTPSLPLGVWRQAGGIERGGFALFCLEDAEFIKLAKERGYLGEGECPGGIKPLGKEIFDLAGKREAAWVIYHLLASYVLALQERSDLFEISCYPSFPNEGAFI